MLKLRIARRTSESPTFAQLAELFRQIQSGRITRRKLQAFLARGTIFKNEEAAREILGQDIFFPYEITEVRGLCYSDDQLNQLAEALPPEVVLRALKKSYVLIPSPPAPMSLLEVRALNPELFYSKSGGWYEGHPFAGLDKTTFGWLAIGKCIVPKSTNKSWENQWRLKPSNKGIPNAAELAWFITTYFELMDVRLLSSSYARTLSRDSDGRHAVSLGRFNEEGLVVDRWEDSDRNTNLGVLFAQKF